MRGGEEMRGVRRRNEPTQSTTTRLVDFWGSLGSLRVLGCILGVFMRMLQVINICWFAY